MNEKTLDTHPCVQYTRQVVLWEDARGYLAEDNFCRQMLGLEPGDETLNNNLLYDYKRNVVLKALGKSTEESYGTNN